MRITRVTANTSTMAMPSNAYTAPLPMPSSSRTAAIVESIRSFRFSSGAGFGAGEVPEFTLPDRGCGGRARALPETAVVRPAPHLEERHHGHDPWHRHRLAIRPARAARLLATL